jgi:hypothetical protein
MNWGKLKPHHYHKEPVEYIYARTLFDLKEYDNLYENQNNLMHEVWKDFDEKYRVGFEFLDDIRDINKDKDIMCLWFFKERTDRSAGNDIKISGKTITYYPNTFFITESKDIKILEKNEYIRRPALQLDLSTSTWNTMLERFNKIV